MRYRLPTPVVAVPRNREIEGPGDVGRMKTSLVRHVEASIVRW